MATMASSAPQTPVLPLSASVQSAAERPSSDVPTTNLWQDILASASRRSQRLARKHVVVLGERNHGKTALVESVIKANPHHPRTVPRSSLDQRDVGPSFRLGASDAAKRDAASKGAAAEEAIPSAERAMPSGFKRVEGVRYDWVDISEDGDMESVPPLSIYSASHEAALGAIPAALPPGALDDTAVVIVLDWTKPHGMVGELLKWLSWIEKWAGANEQKAQAAEGRDRLQSLIQHYVEPSGTAGGSSTFSGAAYAAAGIEMDETPLAEGVMSRSVGGIPIVIVSTKADLIDQTGDALSARGLLAGKGRAEGPRGWAWDDRVDWVGQCLRTVALAYGAAVFYSSHTKPECFVNLRTYLLHRLYTGPPPLRPSSTDAPPILPGSARFPFTLRANVIDRAAVLVPTGWDSWGKIQVVQEGFRPAGILRQWEDAVDKRIKGEAQRDEGEIQDAAEEDEGIEALWAGIVPDVNAGYGDSAPREREVQVEPEQAFLARQLEMLMRDPQRDPRKAFRSVSGQNSRLGSLDDGSGLGAGRGGGVVGPMAGGGLSMPSVDLAMREMEGLQTPVGGRRSRDPATSPGAEGTSAEVLSNFFQGLIAGRRAPATPGGNASDTK